MWKLKLKEGHDDDDDDDAGNEEGNAGLDWFKFRYMMSFHACVHARERPLSSILLFGRVLCVGGAGAGAFTGHACSCWEKMWL